MFISKRIDRLNKNDDVLFHIINVFIEIVLINNVNIENVFLFKNNHIDIIHEYKEKNCFVLESKETSFAVNFDNHKSISRN